ncbi:hypothetical protein BU202_00040 [Streptococcus cuniculi]|uniref:Uncharacterized protein n=1 Tax=Streptococcus cuniculi TaxID=1432788 RepID=A0A1Q8EAA4_9STRE|nr:hypothetical protein [Streptococcus cuniculi]OLF48722.1 hypothetical protein BU202_00040 [Streptococcus cuniculi]
MWEMECEQSSIAPSYGIMGGEYTCRIGEEQKKIIVGKLVIGKRNSINTYMNDSTLNHDKRLKLKEHYREGANYFSAIHSLSILDKPISLDEARRMSPFYAPQGYSYMRNYPELHSYLTKATYATFEINPSESLELLGLFTKDIVEQFQQEIVTPRFLEKFI